MTSINHWLSLEGLHVGGSIRQMWEVMLVVIAMKWMEGGKLGGFIAPVLYMDEI